MRFCKLMRLCKLNLWEFVNLGWEWWYCSAQSWSRDVWSGRGPSSWILERSCWKEVITSFDKNLFLLSKYIFTYSNASLLINIFKIDQNFCWVK